jgi:hypothetical protein
MMIKDLEMHEDLARDELAAVRGGILPGGWCGTTPPGSHVPTVEELLSKLFPPRPPIIITDNPGPVFDPSDNPLSQQ